MTVTNESTASSHSPRPSEHMLPLYDGTELFYRAWLPEPRTDGQAQRALFLFHRGHEHSGRLVDVVEALGLRETAVFAWDARGHGRTPGARGDAPSFAATVRDIDYFVRGIGARHQVAMENSVVLGHSLGAVGLAAWVHDYAPPIRGMVLVAPAFRVKLYVPFALAGLRLLRWFRGGGDGGGKSFVTSYVRPSMLTHDRAQAAAYRDDPLIGKAIAVHVLVDMHDTATRVLKDAAAIETPTLVLSAGAEWVVKNAAQRQFFERLSSPVKAMRAYPGMYHDLLHEQQRAPVLAEIRAFVEACFARADPPAAPVNDDARGFTREEHQRLTAPPSFSATRFNLALQRVMMKTLGRLSHGIRLGWRSGFNSGPMLDYVYKNRPAGALWIGKSIDRRYLDAIGWRGVRQRKAHLQELLRRAIRQQQESGGGNAAVRVVDVAAGAGRYLIEVFQGQDKHGLSALLRDLDETALATAREHAIFHGLGDVIQTARGDAFDEAALGALDPPPTIAIVSGLFELFPDNARVLQTLRGLAAALRRGAAQCGGQAALLYTGQPWHPQLEMIARVLTGGDRRPWVMRRRTQYELDFLVRSAGFSKYDMRIDGDGIFTVSAAHIGTSDA